MKTPHINQQLHSSSTQKANRQRKGCVAFCSHTLHSGDNDANFPVLPMIPSKIPSFDTHCIPNKEDTCRNSKETWLKQLPQVCPCLGNYLFISLMSPSLPTWQHLIYRTACGIIFFLSLRNQFIRKYSICWNLYVLQELTVLKKPLLEKAPWFALGNRETCM